MRLKKIKICIKANLDKVDQCKTFDDLENLFANLIIYYYEETKESRKKVDDYHKKEKDKYSQIPSLRDLGLE